jgi:hypothetical protein
VQQQNYSQRESQSHSFPRSRSEWSHIVILTPRIRYRFDPSTACDSSDKPCSPTCCVKRGLHFRFFHSASVFGVLLIPSALCVGGCEFAGARIVDTQRLHYRRGSLFCLRAAIYMGRSSRRSKGRVGSAFFSFFFTKLVCSVQVMIKCCTPHSRFILRSRMAERVTHVAFTLESCSVPELNITKLTPQHLSFTQPWSMAHIMHLHYQT